MSAKYSLEYAAAPDAPLPLTRVQAFHRAAELKLAGWEWSTIRLVMGEYHGQFISASGWRAGVRNLGLEVPKRELSPERLRHLRELHALNRARNEMARAARKEPVDGVAA